MCHLQHYNMNVFHSVVFQLLSYVWVFGTLWTAAHQTSLNFTLLWSLLQLTSIESVMVSKHLILYCPLLLLPSIFPSSTSEGKLYTFFLMMRKYASSSKEWPSPPWRRHWPEVDLDWFPVVETATSEHKHPEHRVQADGSEESGRTQLPCRKEENKEAKHHEKPHLYSDDWQAEKTEKLTMMGSGFHVSGNTLWLTFSWVGIWTAAGEITHLKTCILRH